MRLAGTIWRALHAAHPVVRAVIGGILVFLAVAWLQRAGHAVDPFVRSANSYLGWSILLLGAYLSISGLWPALTQVWAGAPHDLRNQKAFGEAGDAPKTSSLTPLSGERASPTRPRFKD